MHVCGKGKCPNRISIGSSKDDDAVSFVCVECTRLYYLSDRRTFDVFFFCKWILAFVLLFGLVYLFISNSNYDLNSEDSLTTSSTMDGKRKVNGKEGIIIEEPLDEDEVFIFLKDYYRKGDALNHNDQILMMDFNLLNYYNTTNASESTVRDAFKNYTEVLLKMQNPLFYEIS